MDMVVLGNTRLEVSKLCFGGIPFGGRGWRNDPPLPTNQAAKVLERAFELGINFWDTAENYGSHPHMRMGFELVDRSKVVLSTKTAKESYDEVKKSLERSLQELGTDYLDIIYLHYFRAEDLQRREGALRAMMEAKDEGLVNHIGISTHWNSAVESVIDLPEIDVIMVKLNKIGRMDCSINDMLKAVERAYGEGKGIVSIKLLAYGDLGVREGLEFSLNLPFVHSACIGIRTLQELEEDVRIYETIVTNQ